eukprot:gene20200-1675_t
MGNTAGTQIPRTPRQPQFVREHPVATMGLMGCGLLVALGILFRLVLMSLSIILWMLKWLESHRAAAGTHGAVDMARGWALGYWDAYRRVLAGDYIEVGLACTPTLAGNTVVEAGSTCNLTLSFLKANGRPPTINLTSIAAESPRAAMPPPPRLGSHQYRGSDRGPRVPSSPAVFIEARLRTSTDTESADFTAHGSRPSPPLPLSIMDGGNGQINLEVSSRRAGEMQLTVEYLGMPVH